LHNCEEGINTFCRFAKSVRDLGSAKRKVIKIPKKLKNERAAHVRGSPLVAL
jgi:hypothetical protein